MKLQRAMSFVLALLAATGLARAAAATPSGAGPERPASLDGIGAVRARVPSHVAMRALPVQARASGVRGGVVHAAAPGLLTWPESSRYREDEARCEKPIDDASRSVLGLLVEEKLVEKVESALGPSPLQREGDAGKFRQWRCWRAANGDRTILVVGAGEVHGYLRILGPEMAFGEAGSCPRSSKVHRGLATASGIKLGLTRAQIEAKVGPASRAGQAWYERVCFTPARLSAEQAARLKAEGDHFFTIASALRVVEKNGKAAGIEITWSETY